MRTERREETNVKKRMIRRIRRRPIGHWENSEKVESVYVPASSYRFIFEESWKKLRKCRSLSSSFPLSPRSAPPARPASVWIGVAAPRPTRKPPVPSPAVAVRGRQPGGQGGWARRPRRAVLVRGFQVEGTSSMAYRSAAIARWVIFLRDKKMAAESHERWKIYGEHWMYGIMQVHTSY